jgi:hypothetical protein
VRLTEGGNMRHLIGIVMAIAMAGALFFTAAWGYLRLLRMPASATPLSGLSVGGSLLSDHSVLASLIAVAGTGLLAGIMVSAPRISPLAAGLPGLGLLGWTALYLVSTRHAIDLIPLTSHAYGAGFEAMLRNGILGAAGLAMITPLFVSSRWRARDNTASEMTEARDFVASMTPGSRAHVPAEPAGWQA